MDTRSILQREVHAHHPNRNYILLGALLLGGLLWGCGSKEEQVQEIKIRPVKAAMVQKAGLSGEQRFSGSAQASKDVTLSFKVSGAINRILVKVGDKVRRGQLIASIDALDYSVQRDQSLAQLKSAETQIKGAQAQLVSSRGNYDRVEKLYENNSVPLSDYEQAKAALEAAQSSYDAAVAQVRASEKQVEAARNQVGYASLTAPFAGIITSVSVEENELINVGAPVANLISEANPEVLIGVPESFISGIAKGQKVRVNFSVLKDRSYDGEVFEVGFSSSTATTYPVTVRILQPDAAIRPGMAADVHFRFESDPESEGKIVAPAVAIGEGSEGNFVFKLVQENDVYKVVKQPVAIGPLIDHGFEIESGLAEGDLVAVAGLRALLDGMTVRLMTE